MNPGSPEAVAAGCTCPIGDNHNGAGIPMTVKGKQVISFWHSGDCPIHDKQEEKDD
jgi:hypothetical protein